MKASRQQRNYKNLHLRNLPDFLLLAVFGHFHSFKLLSPFYIVRYLSGMARCSLFTLAVVAIGVLGANAGPCRPTTVTSLTETSSVATVESSSTGLTEASSRSLSETTTTLLETLSTTTTETSSQTLSETSSITLETLTTSEVPSCVETQVVVNPSFDDNNGAPWTGSGSTTTNDPNSGSHAW